MMDHRQLREPVEVYEAALGVSEPLAKRLETLEALTFWEFRALSFLVQGKLDRPKRKQGQRNLPYLTDTEEGHRVGNLRMAAKNCDFYMLVLKDQYGSNYGCSKEVYEHVAKEHGLTEHELHDFRNRSKKDTEESTSGWPDPVIVHFHRWMHRTGKLTEFPPYINPIHAMSRWLSES